jgi:hypothetical protein
MSHLQPVIQKQAGCLGTVAFDQQRKGLPAVVDALRTSRFERAAGR